jgi:splicing factor 3A subunit 1
MAPAATNGDLGNIDDIKPPAGVVLPPREIRTILEKTAGYVARNGMNFEDRIRDKESANPKFSFLSTDDAYNAYYLWRLHEIKSGRGTAVSAGRVPDAESPAEQKPNGPPKPPDFQFSARMPRINQKDLDVVKLTALFVAKNGRQFMTQLAQREAGNPQFQFLIPNHTFHNFFQHLVDQYSTLIKASGLDGEGGKLQQLRVEELKRNIKDKYLALGRAKARGEYGRYQETEKLKEADQEEQKKLEFARIDWNDFVVVETILFTDADNQAILPPPSTLSDLQYASLEERKQMSISSNLRIEEAMPTDFDGPYQGYPAQASYPLPVHTGYNPQQTPQNGQAMYAPAPVQPLGLSAEQEEEERRIQERAEERTRIHQAQAEAMGGAAPMKIKENYVPKAAQRAANKQQMVICPNCKQQFPVNELEEHMRSEFPHYQLLFPSAHYWEAMC